MPQVLMMKETSDSSRWSVHHVRVVSFLLLGSYLDHVVDPEDGDGRLRGKLEALDLAHGRLKDARLLVVPDNTVDEIQTIPRERSAPTINVNNRAEFARKLSHSSFLAASTLNS